jgi:hypothetical protein
MACRSSTTCHTLHTKSCQFVKLHCDYVGILHVATKTCQCGTYAVLTNFNVLVLVVEDVVAVICVRVDEGRGVEAGRVECGHGCGPLHIRP